MSCTRMLCLLLLGAAVQAACEEAELFEDEGYGLQCLEGEEEGEEGGWQGMDQVHLAGMDSLVELMEGLVSDQGGGMHGGLVRFSSCVSGCG